jgi:hypothetical protein
MKGVLEAMKGNDEFFTFHEEVSTPAPTTPSTTSKKTPGKDEISIAGGGISITSRVSRANTQRSTVSFASSVMSPMTSSGETNTIATGMSHAEVKQLVVQTMEENIVGPLQQMQQQMNSLAERMDQSLTALHINHSNYAASPQDDGEQQSL